VVKRLCT